MSASFPVIEVSGTKVTVSDWSENGKDNTDAMRKVAVRFMQEPNNTVSKGATGAQIVSQCGHGSAGRTGAFTHDGDDHGRNITFQVVGVFTVDQIARLNEKALS